MNQDIRTTSSEDTSPAIPSPTAEIERLEKLQKQFASDMEALRAQEANLRAYESRLREARPQPGPVAAGAAPGAEELQAAWEKFHRAQALLEAERRALTDERLSYRELSAAVRAREEDLKRRESWLAQREAAAAAPRQEKPAATGGLRLGLNEIPFADMFRSHKKSA
jgi:chromosome segregation ATPase